MSDQTGDTSTEEKPFLVDKAKQGRANCKKCKQKCPTGELRIAKLAHNPFGEGKMKNWHHVNCMFEVFFKQRPTTKRIESPDDLEGWIVLSKDDQKVIMQKIKECEKHFEEKHGIKPKPSPKKASVVNKNGSPSKPSGANCSTSNTNSGSKDLLFRTFRKLVADISNVSSYIEKTNLVRELFTKGSEGDGFKGDLYTWCELLLPGEVKRIYNLQSKQLVKLFSRIFNTNQSDMLKHLEQGDVAETVQHFFEKSSAVKRAQKSTLTIHEVNDFLAHLSSLTKEQEQAEHFEKFIKKCTGNDLKIVIRLIKHDLRMNAGAKHILQGVHADAYAVYQSCRDIKTVINKCLGTGQKVTTSALSMKAAVSIMTPVLPMLAEACKSVEQAMAKCPNGMFSEIKYDGERVQVHKLGTDFKFFSRSLKPVLFHKVKHFVDYIPKAFPHGKDLILDSEILMVDTNTQKPLPFGTLGVHKKNEFQNASVCLYVFDCIYYNGESLTQKPLRYRKKILKENMTEIPNHIVFSEMEEVTEADELSTMIAKVLKLGLEGLVLKDTQSIYEPGKRHWLKVKKDYLFEGAMADTADLIVLGAWYGTGKKGGMMSVFLMGCYDPERQVFCTVTKVHTGHDDKTLEQLQTELDMVKISGDPLKVPNWLSCAKAMVPDFVARDPKKQPVWEITGAEFTKHEVHTADGISIRFPRVTKIREDKYWITATNLYELQKLYKASKDHTDVSLLLKGRNTTGKISSKPTQGTKRKTQPSASATNAEPSGSGAIPKKTKSLGLFDMVIKPLPDYFMDVEILLESGLKEKFSDWVRYFIAYGGNVLSPDDWKTATHVVHARDIASKHSVKNFPKNAKHVTVQWLVDSVSNRKLQDWRPYCVYLDQ